MLPKVRCAVVAVVLGAACAFALACRFPSGHWLRFLVYAGAVLLTSRMKVRLPRGDGSMSVNFPFLLLAVVELSPAQALALAALSVAIQSRIRPPLLMSVVQLLYNASNATLSTAACWFTYVWLCAHQVEAAPSLAAGATLYFLLNSAGGALVIAWSQGAKPFQFWRKHMSWYMPFYLVGAGLSALAHFLGVRFGVGTALLVLPAAYTMYRAYNAQIARVREHEQHTAEMEALHLRTIESLAMAIEAKDQETHDHLLRVRVYVTALGEALGLTSGEMDAVKTAALLHDIGKLAVPEHIINKPGKLTPAEFEKMKIHPVVGADILERVRFPYPVVPIVRAHHEWWNGNGYPDGLSGEAIPIGARILTVVDCFDAMASDRPYRRAMPLAEAMAKVKSMAGTQFDPRVVAELEARYEGLELKAREEAGKHEWVALNTEVAVNRGLAPGAGFAAEAAAAGVLPANSLDAAALARVSVPGDGARSLGEVMGEAGGFRLCAELIYEVHRTLRGGGPLPELLLRLSGRLAAHLPFDCMVLYLREGERLVPLRADALAVRCFSDAPVPFGTGISGWAAEHHRPNLNGNPGVEPHALRGAGRTLASAMAVPLRLSDGDIYGVLTFYSLVADAFSRDHLRAVETAAGALTWGIRRVVEGAEPLPERAPTFAPTPASTESLFRRIHGALSEKGAGMPSLTLLMCESCGQTEPMSPARLEPGEVFLSWGSRGVLITAATSALEVRDRTSALHAWIVAGGRCPEVLPEVAVARSPLDGDTPENLLAAAEGRLLSARRPESTTLHSPCGGDLGSSVLPNSPISEAVASRRLQATPHPPRPAYAIGAGRDLNSTASSGEEMRLLPVAAALPRPS